MATVFGAVIELLRTFGLFRVILPFMLVFAIVYAVLKKTQILGDQPWSDSVAAIISLAIAFFVIASTPVVSALERLLPNTAFLLVVIVLFLMVLGMFGFNIGDIFQDKKAKIILALIFTFIFLALVGFAAPDMPVLGPFAKFLMGPIEIPELTEETVALIVVVGILIAVVVGIPYFITRSTGGTEIG